jgi:hypothetical protein
MTQISMVKANRSFAGTSAAIFRMEEQAKQETSMTHTAGSTYRLCSRQNKRFYVVKEVTLFA